MKVKILTDSSSDLTEDLLEKYEIDRLSLVVTKGEEQYLDSLTISAKMVYDGMRNGEVFTTSQVPPNSFKEKFEEYAKDNLSVIYLGFSSELSGTYQGAVFAKEEVLEKYPDFDISLVDTKAASLGFGLIVLEAARLAKEGKSKEEILTRVDFYLDNIQHIFTVDDIEYLYRGGRITKTAAFVGGLLNIKPILSVKDGKLEAIEKVRGQNKVYKAMLNIMDERAKETDLSNQLIGISHGDAIEGANKLKEMIGERFGPKDFIITEIGPTIGAHVGPGTLAIFFMKKYHK